MDQKVFKYILSFLIFITFCTFGITAEDFVIPVIKSPFQIDKVEWSDDGKQFSISTNQNTYVRDTLDLSLKDTYPQKRSSGRKGNYPSRVIAYGKNKNGTLEAAVCEDNKIYLYDTRTNEIKTIGNHNSKANNLVFTKNNNLLIADAEKSAGLYTLTGEKIKTFATANRITSLAITNDGENAVFAYPDGSLHFYDTNSSREMGFIPALNNSGVKEIAINKETSKALVSFKNGNVFYVRIGDLLFNPNSQTPNLKHFPIAYDALTAEAIEEADVREFKVKEIEVVDNIDPEFIESTKENKDKQTFKINEKKNNESVVIKKTQTEKTFTYSTEEDNDLSLSKKYPENEITSYVQEFNQDLSGVGIPSVKKNQKQIQENNTTKVTEFPEVIRNPENVYVTPVQPVQQTPIQQNPVPTTVIIAQIQNTVPVETTVPKEIPQNTQPITIIINDQGKKEPDYPEYKEEEKEKKSQEPKKEKELKERKERTVEPEEEKAREEVYRTGHLLIANIAVSPLQDPFMYELSAPLGYKNFNLIKPFYFGGIFEPFLGIPSSEFPYVYKISGNASVSPRLVGVKIYAPIGFSIRPLKNSLTIYSDLNFGLSLNSIWNGKIGKNRIATKVYPAFYGAVKIGAMWRFIDLNIIGSYDGITKLSIGAELGFSISIGTQNITGGGTTK